MKNNSIPKTVNIIHINEWEITKYSNQKIINPIIIEGMPGIGNVGKISMDILIEETKAKLLMSFFSKNLPNSVFVNEENLVDLPKMELYYKHIGTQDYLFLTGDVQPVNEHASYNFCEMIIQLLKEFNTKHLVTLGGIGLSTVPETPKIYITGNDKNFVQEITKSFTKQKFVYEPKIYGMVGPIMGISGLLLGMARKQNLKAYCLLAETFGHPVYVGLKGSKNILYILNKYYKLNINLDKLDKEIKKVDNPGENQNTDSGSDKDSAKYKKYSDVNYIG
jgi:uncharacterized protein (TIGR00162 family)